MEHENQIRPNVPEDSYVVSFNDKRSGPPGSLAHPSAVPTAPSQNTPPAQTAEPPTLPQTLHIIFSTSFDTPSSISASPSPDTPPLYHLNTQTIRTPHLSLFSAPTKTEIGTATLANHGGSIACVIHGAGVTIKQKSKLSSSFLASVPGLGDLVWKGDRHALTCEAGDKGGEVARMSMEKAKKENDWVVQAKVEFEGEMTRDEKECLLVMALAVQEYKKRKGQGIWGSIGKGGLSSTMV